MINEYEWIVIDLRQNQIAIAHLKEGENRIDWVKQEIQYDRGYTDHDYVLDLSFYRSVRSKTWIKTQSDYLNKLDDENFEKIPSLFDKPVEWLEKNLEKILRKSAKSFLTEFKTLPILIMCDRPDALPVIKNVFREFENDRPDGIVAYIPSSSCDLSGFALLDAREQDQNLPQPGSLFAVSIVYTVNTIPVEETLGYCWNGLSFEPRQNLTIIPKKNTPFVGTRSDLERAGTAEFAIRWQPKLAENQKQELLNIRKRISEKEEILKRVKSLLSRLNLDSDLQ